MRMNHHTEGNSLPPSHPSDIAEWEEKYEGQTHTTPSRWRCGDPKKRKEAVTNFAQSSSLHAVAYVCASGRKNTSQCVKIIYRVLFTICFLVVISSIVSLLQEKFSKQSTFINSINRDMDTGVDEDPEYFPLYPRITICRRPFYRTDYNESYLQLVEYAMLSLGSPFGPFTPTELGMTVQLVQHQLQIVKNLSEAEIEFRDRMQLMESRYKTLKKSDGFELSQFIVDHSVGCSEFFSSCVAHIHPFDCCSVFSAVVTTSGVCFTLRDVAPIAKISVALDVAASVVVDLVTPDTPQLHTEHGFRVFLTDPSMEIPILLGEFGGEDIVPGITTTVKAHLAKTQRTALHTPWHGIWATCPRWRYNDTNDTSRYSIDMCDLLFYNRMMRKKCDCQTLFHHYAGPEDLRTCEPYDMYHCFFNAVFENNLSELASTCYPPCTAYSFKTESSYMGLGGDMNISRLEIIYNSKQYTYNEYRKATLSSLFSQIGGSLGLYLGASIITLVELFTFGVTWLWYRLAPAKVASTTAKVHPYHSGSGRHY